jgi:hypothetical protein
MYHADSSHDSADRDRVSEPRPKHQSDDEIVGQRTPIVADSGRPESEHLPADRRKGERRRIDRMSTGI